ncbi:hypothetical protein [Blattabacterium sp. (Cryptocercus punctulatus) str. Cpu]|uniref:hypothetical protein n=1 Tax=Blattabacterium sp. (Cryptocercus punctulatus) str. Cpu TaxID=1075399 RepID=UPI00023872E4|nr:hypothetical protein [Blattabacterium sp. (Cryptocercus punctulatus) str. Cpu]AEU09311.1 hypothetical protein BLBCPU_257 [Blattabacterium sp. (Cryptocercus punctulatus) str. Cpu]
MYRNFFAVFIGILVSITEIIYSIKLIKNWFINIQFIPLKNIQHVFIHAPSSFFITLFFFYAFSALLGGITTAFFVQNAKKAYAGLTGIILFIIAFIHIFLYTLPLWFEIVILPIFFHFSYLGGAFIELLQRKKWIN